jgi:hypothetical protein
MEVPLTNPATVSSGSPKSSRSHSSTTHSSLAAMGEITCMAVFWSQKSPRSHRGEAGGNHAAVHEAEVPSPHLGHRGGRAAVVQFCEDLLRRGELQRELFVEESEVRQSFSVGEDVAVEDGGRYSRP